ncbi:protease [Mucilaginibacter xinganensis]|nr:protease [Mucilaginibacter xinganensis]
MKNISSILFITMLTISACSVKTRNNQSTDSTANAGTPLVEKGLFAKMKIKDTIKAGDSVLLKFTVYNPADSAQQFCKWHTPFEPLMSKYLDVKSESGEEADYRGAMAKRIMPPPASSYIKVKGKDSLSANVDLLKAFAIIKPARYTITYNSQSMSGLRVTDSVSFVYKAK